jgi:hypothetical protein
MKRPDPYRALDFEAPIIIVGAGRSGTTLLDAMIESHPDVYSIGETSFLLHRLWEALIERKSYYERTAERLARHAVARGASVTWSGFGISNFANVMRRIARREFLDRPVLSWKDMAYTRASMDPYGDFPTAWEKTKADEAKRLPRELAASFARLMIPPQLVRSHWMFREIWVGSPAFAYDYSLFKMAFPKAKYVHCVRHPIDYLESVSKVHQQNFDAADAMNHLTAWLNIVRRARELSETQSYFELSYEDLVSEQSQRRLALFQFLGLSMHPDCLDRLDLRFVPTKADTLYSQHARKWIDAVPGLRSTMEQFGYSDKPFGRLRNQAEVR